MQCQDGNYPTGTIRLPVVSQTKISVTVSTKKAEKQMILREYLSQKIKADDMTAAQLSRKAGVPTPSITRFLQGKRGLSTESIDALARAFNESPIRWARMAAGDSTAAGIGDDETTLRRKGNKVAQKSGKRLQRRATNEAIIADIAYDLGHLSVDDLKRIKTIVNTFVPKG